MLHVAMNMQSLLENKKAAKFVKGGMFTKPSKAFNKSTTQSTLLKNFVLVYVKMTEMQIWWPNVEIILRGPKNTVIKASQDYLQNENGVPINADSLCFKEIGDERLQDYFLEFIWLNPEQVK